MLQLMESFILSNFSQEDTQGLFPNVKKMEMGWTSLVNLYSCHAWPLPSNRKNTGLGVVTARAQPLSHPCGLRQEDQLQRESHTGEKE